MWTTSTEREDDTMKDSTLKLIALAAKSDPECDASTVRGIEWWLQLPPVIRANIMDTGSGDQVISRREVARLFGKSVKWVDYVSRRADCPFRRIRIGSSRRACGFSANSVQEALSSTSQKEVK